jgi:hypothetical protein
VDRHCFDAEPGSDLPFRCLSGSGSYPSFTHVGKSEIYLFTFINSNASLHSFFYLVCVIGVVIFRFFDSILNLYRKKFGKALHLVEMEKDPDRQPLDADPDPAK